MTADEGAVPHVSPTSLQRPAVKKGVGAGRGGRRFPGALLRWTSLWSRQVPAVLVPQIQFLDSGWTVLFCVQRQYPQCKLCSSPSRFFRCRSWTRLTCPLLCNARCAVFGCHGHRHPCRGADAVSLGPVSSCTSLTRCRCLCCAGPSDSTSL